MLSKLFVGILFWTSVLEFNNKAIMKKRIVHAICVFNVFP